MGIRMITAGLAFLFLPSYNMLDLMPDFIGFWLIFRGLRRLALTDDKLQTARGVIFKLIFISMTKSAAGLLLAGYNDETTTMTFTVIFALVETVMLFIAASALNEGLYYAALRHGTGHSERAYNDVHACTCVFVIARAVLVCVPELVVLANPSYQMADEMRPFTLYDYRRLILVACLLISLIIGVFFIATTARYYSSLRRDANLIDALKEKYARALAADPGYMLRAGVREGFLFAVAGFILMSTMLLEGVNVLPNSAAFGLLLVGMLRMRSYTRGLRLPIILSVVGIVYSAVSYAFAFYTANTYYQTFILEGEALMFYRIRAIGEAGEYILLGAVAVLFFRAVAKLVEKHCVAPGLSHDTVQYAEQTETVALLRRSIYISAAAGGAVSVLCAAAPFIYITNETIWLIASAAVLLWCVYVGRTLMQAYTVLKRRNS